MDMNDIEKALKQDDFCQAMDDLSFALVGYDEEYPDVYYFQKKDNSLIVMYKKEEEHFWTYPIANNREIK